MTLGAQRATSTMLTRESPVVGVVFSSTKKRPSHKRRVRFGIKTETIPEASNEIDVDETDRMQRLRAVLVGDEPTPVARRIFSMPHAKPTAWRATKQRLRSRRSASRSSDS